MAERAQRALQKYYVFVVYQANIKPDTANQNLENLPKNVWVSGLIVRSSMYFLLIFEVLDGLYLFQC